MRSTAGVVSTLEDARTDRAVTETIGQVRIDSKGAVARTEFSSSTGGYTAGGVFPAVPDDGDAIAANPNVAWVASVSGDAIEQAYPQLGVLVSVTVTGRNGLGPFGGTGHEDRAEGHDVHGHAHGQRVPRRRSV